MTRSNINLIHGDCMEGMKPALARFNRYAAQGQIF